LTASARRMFGTNPAVAVRIQTEMLRHRLGFFAFMQAQRRRDGWRIAHVEWSPKGADCRATLDVDNIAMGLRGKIDRIDTHEDGRSAVIDYKTGSDASRAEGSHRNRDGRWTNLQLPLYRHLVSPLGLPGDLELGYAGLPSKTGEDVWSFVDWKSEDLQDADEAARDIVRRIRSYAPGDDIDLGDYPPDAGALGFITGKRFEIGGRAGEDDVEEAGGMS
jgi:ATP-dependent helicase/nuclease subunit B